MTSTADRFAINEIGCLPSTRNSYSPKNSVRIFMVDVRRRRTRTVKIRTALSRHCPPGQTDNGQLFSIIRTESGQQTDTGHDFPENPDKNKTRTGHGQCCPPTSDQTIFFRNVFLLTLMNKKFMMIFMKLNSSEIFVSRVQNTVRLKSSHPMWFTSRLACWRFSFLKNYSICGWVGFKVIISQNILFSVLWIIRLWSNYLNNRTQT